MSWRFWKRRKPEEPHEKQENIFDEAFYEEMIEKVKDWEEASVIGEYVVKIRALPIDMQVTICFNLLLSFLDNVSGENRSNFLLELDATLLKKIHEMNLAGEDVKQGIVMVEVTIPES